MTLVSTIEFSSTHHLVALSRNHFRHFRFQKPETKIAAIRQIKSATEEESRRPSWVPHGSYDRDRRTHIFILW